MGDATKDGRRPLRITGLDVDADRTSAADGKSYPVAAVAEVEVQRCRVQPGFAAAIPPQPQIAGWTVAQGRKHQPLEAVRGGVAVAIGGKAKLALPAPLVGGEQAV